MVPSDQPTRDRAVITPPMISVLAMDESGVRYFQCRICASVQRTGYIARIINGRCWVSSFEM